MPGFPADYSPHLTVTASLAPPLTLPPLPASSRNLGNRGGPKALRPYHTGRWPQRPRAATTWVYGCRTDASHVYRRQRRHALRLLVVGHSALS